MTKWQQFSYWVGNITIAVVIVSLISGWAKPSGLTGKGVVILCYATHVVKEINFSEEGEAFCAKILNK